MLVASLSDTGASTDTWCVFTLSTSSILSWGMSVFSAISSMLGRRSFSCSNWLSMRFILLTLPTWFNGKRTTRLCSAIACSMLWRIHHTAYEMNLKPRVSSNFSAALSNPMFPSLIRSGRLKPWFWYCFATETTKRRFDFVSFSKALRSPVFMRRASSASSSTDISSSCPMSWRYLSSEAFSRFVIELVIFSCLIKCCFFDIMFCKFNQ